MGSRDIRGKKKIIIHCIYVELKSLWFRMEKQWFEIIMWTPFVTDLLRKISG